MESTIIIPKSTHVEFDIPVEYVGKKLEVIYPELDEPKKKEAKWGDFLGILSKESGEAMQAEIAKMRDEWDRDI